MSKTISLTSKNQITLPVALVRRAGLLKGARFTPRLENGVIILEPQEDIRTTTKKVQAAMRPLVRHPLSDEELQRALHDWNE